MLLSSFCRPPVQTSPVTHVGTAALKPVWKSRAFTTAPRLLKTETMSLSPL